MEKGAHDAFGDERDEVDRAVFDLEIAPEIPHCLADVAHDVAHRELGAPVVHDLGEV